MPVVNAERRKEVKRKKMKRILAIFLILIMLFTFSSVAVAGPRHEPWASLKNNETIQFVVNPAGNPVPVFFPLQSFPAR